MTKTDFVAIQTAIADARSALLAGVTDRLANQVFDSMSRSVAATLAKQNPKFKRNEFLRGCGVQ